VISPGEDIFTDIPLVHAQTVDTLSISPACATCTTSLLTPAVYFETTWSRMPEKLQRQIEEYWPHITPITCPNCPFELYCSESCRIQAWNSYHRILCPSINPETTELYQFCANRQIIVRETWNSIFSPMVLAKLIAMIILNVVNSVESKLQSIYRFLIVFEFLNSHFVYMIVYSVNLFFKMEQLQMV